MPLLNVHKQRVWGVLGYTGLLLLIACGSTATPTAVSTPTPTQAPRSETATSDEEAYRELVDLVLTTIGQGTRLLSDVGIQLSRMPEEAPQVEGIVTPTKGTFELARQQLEDADPPPGYEELHQQLLDALRLYEQAAEAILPDPKTQEADYWRFQELMQQGGKNAHGAAATLQELNRPK